MTADLTPDVRDAAEWAARRACLDGNPATVSDSWAAIVNAVAAVVLGEARPLQARIEELEARELLTEEQAGRMAEEIEELEGQVSKQEIAFQGRVLLEEVWRKEKAALQARVKELEAKAELLDKVHSVVMRIEDEYTFTREIVTLFIDQRLRSQQRYAEEDAAGQEEKP
jgi:hypothetical protein